MKSHHSCPDCGRTLSIYNLKRKCCLAATRSLIKTVKMERKASRKAYWATVRGEK